MNHAKNVFSILAQKARRGDAGARTQIERALMPIVRRVIQNGAGRSCLDRRILDEARRCEGDARAGQDELIRRVVRSLCSTVIGQMRPAASAEHLPGETIASFANPARRWSA